MNKMNIVFNKQEIRDSLPKDTYQELLCQFGGSRIDKICSALLMDSIQITRDMVLDNTQVENVILRYVDPVHYLTRAPINSIDEEIEGVDCREFFPPEFTAVYNGVVAITDHIRNLAIPVDIYKQMNMIHSVTPIDKYTLTVAVDTYDE